MSKVQKKPKSFCQYPLPESFFTKIDELCSLLK